jgi:hypothetical protein
MRLGASCRKLNMVSKAIFGVLITNRFRTGLNRFETGCFTFPQGFLRYPVEKDDSTMFFSIVKFPPKCSLLCHRYPK